jgi:hypothetical protein
MSLSIGCDKNTTPSEQIQIIMNNWGKHTCFCSEYTGVQTGQVKATNISDIGTKFEVQITQVLINSGYR